LLLAVSVILVYAFWSIRREVSFGIVWYLISILPVLNLTLLNAPLMEHWLYLPLIGLTLAFVGLVRTLAERVGEVRGAAVGLILLALLLSARTATRNAEWNNHVRLFSRDVSYYPGNYLAWFWLADALQQRGMLHDAIRALQAGLAIDPYRRRAWIALGESLSLTGRNDEAEEAFSRAFLFSSAV
jgi:tetratricopeptide (TPR) repeat protein